MALLYRLRDEQLKESKLRYRIIELQKELDVVLEQRIVMQEALFEVLLTGEWKSGKDAVKEAGNILK